MEDLIKGCNMNERSQVLFYEDMLIGDGETSVGRTVTETDIVNFSGLSGDYNTIHTDADYAKNSFFGKRVAHGLLVKAIASGLYTRTNYNQRMMPSLIALLEIRQWKFLKPVFIGDTIKIKVTLTHKEDKPVKPYGKVVFFREIINQENEIVQSGEYSLLIKKRQGEEV